MASRNRAPASPLRGRKESLNHKVKGHRVKGHGRPLMQSARLGFSQHSSVTACCLLDPAAATLSDMRNNITENNNNNN